MTTIKPRNHFSDKSNSKRRVQYLCLVPFHYGVNSIVHCCCQPRSFQLQQLSLQRSSHSVLPRGRRATQKSRRRVAFRGLWGCKKVWILIWISFLCTCWALLGSALRWTATHCNQIIKVRGQSCETETMVIFRGNTQVYWLSRGDLHQPSVQFERSNDPCSWWLLGSSRCLKFLQQEWFESSKKMAVHGIEKQPPW